MPIEKKTFTYSGSFKSLICTVKVTSSAYGTIIMFIVPDNNLRTEVYAHLESIHVSPKLKDNGVSIQRPSYDTVKIRDSINALKNKDRMTDEFANEIIANYPDGYGGIMDLSSSAHTLMSNLRIIGPGANLSSTQSLTTDQITQQARLVG